MSASVNCEKTADMVRAPLAASTSRSTSAVQRPPKPDVAKQNVLAALRSGAHVVVGTSGLSETDYAEIDVVAREHNRGVLAVGNFALTAVLLQKFAEAAAKLIPQPGDWRVVSSYAGEQLATALSQRVEASGYPPGERAQLLEGGLQMIEQGTAPESANFDQFEPVLDAEGRIVAIRFVFPPYQVGPYSEGAQSVEVPARVLLPVVAPGYRPLFKES